MIESALNFVDNTDRDKWVMAAMAIKSEMGDDGFDLWDSWSAQAHNYNVRDAKAVWRSVKGAGGITIGSLYAEARKNGFTGDFAPTGTNRCLTNKNRSEGQNRALEWKSASMRAEQMVREASYSAHPYLIRKGFGDQRGLVLDRNLLIPMRDVQSGALNSLQTISPEGEKKFLARGRAKGSVFSLGNKGQVFLCEGYATGLSIKAALAALYSNDRVVVCFSASNLTHVAQFLGDFVVADHDASATGEKYARKTGLPFWMPPEEGQDANDFHKNQGIQALAANLRSLSSKKSMEAVNDHGF